MSADTMAWADYTSMDADPQMEAMAPESMVGEAVEASYDNRERGGEA